MAKFQVYADRRGEYRWRFRADNGEIIAMSSESYKSVDSCRHGMKLVQSKAADAQVEDALNPNKSASKAGSKPKSAPKS